MLLCEVNNMCRLVQRFRQVPNQEILRLINCKKLTQSSSKLYVWKLTLIRATSSRFWSLFWWLFVFLGQPHLIILEVQIAPLNLCDWVLTCLVPNSDRRCVMLMEHSKRKWRYKRENSFIAYPIEPHVKPANKYPLSDIDKAVGAPRLSVSSLVGMLDCLLLNLKSPLHVEK